ASIPAILDPFAWIFIVGLYLRNSETLTALVSIRRVLSSQAPNHRACYPQQLICALAEFQIAGFQDCPKFQTPMHSSSYCSVCVRQSRFAVDFAESDLLFPVAAVRESVGFPARPQTSLLALVG